MLCRPALAGLCLPYCLPRHTQGLTGRGLADFEAAPGATDVVHAHHTLSIAENVRSSNISVDGSKSVR